MKQFELMTDEKDLSKDFFHLTLDKSTIDLGDSWDKVQEALSLNGSGPIIENGRSHRFDPYAFNSLKELIESMNDQLGFAYPWHTYGKEWCFYKPSTYLMLVGMPIESLSEDFDWINYLQYADVQRTFGQKADGEFSSNGSQQWFIARTLPLKLHGVLDTVGDRFHGSAFHSNNSLKGIGALANVNEKLRSIRDVNPYTTSDAAVVTPVASPFDTERAYHSGMNLNSFMLSKNHPARSIFELA